MKAVWASPGVAGPYLRRDDVSDGARPLRTDEITGTERNLYGWIRLEPELWVVGGTAVTREDFGEQPLDWLDIYLPMSALAATDKKVGGYPFGDTSSCREWLEPASAALGELACVVVQAVAATVGYIGFETSGNTETQEWSGSVPKNRSLGYVVPQKEGMADYFPPTMWR